MAWHKKAATTGLTLRFAIFYALLTSGVAVAMVWMPDALLGKSVQPIQIDQSVQAQQIESRLWVTSQYTGRTNPFEYNGNLGDVNLTYTQKLMTYKVTLDGKSAIYDEKFYKIAKPLANFKYLPYNEKKTVMVGGKLAELTIEELYPQKYELKK